MDDRVSHTSQSRMIEHLVALNAIYKQAPDKLKDYTSAKEGVPDFMQPVAEVFYYKPPQQGDSFVGRSRVDLAHTFWADSHRIIREMGNPLMEKVRHAAKSQPDNHELTVLAKVAGDMYGTFGEVYQAAKKVEHRFKRKVREVGLEGSDAFENKWTFQAQDELESDEEVQEAHLALKDALFDEVSGLYSEPRTWERQGILVADYGEAFPDVDDDRLLDAVILGEKLASYSFMAAYGMFGLSDYQLVKALQSSARLGPSAAKELAGLCDVLNEAPYHVSLGLEETDVRKHLTGHSRQVKIYALFEELVTGETSLSQALPHLEALGMDETPEVRTGKEMAALMGAVAYRQGNAEWIATAEALFNAKSRDELLDIVEGEKGQKMLDGIEGMDFPPGSSLARAQTLMKEARSHVDELNIKLPSAAKQFMAQTAAGRDGGCPMHR